MQSCFLCDPKDALFNSIPMKIKSTKCKPPPLCVNLPYAKTFFIVAILLWEKDTKELYFSILSSIILLFDRTFAWHLHVKVFFFKNYRDHENDFFVNTSF